MSLTLLFQSAAGGQTIPVVQALETDLAQPITSSDVVAVVQTNETDLAQAVTALRTRSLGQATSTEAAGVITPTTPVGLAFDAVTRHPSPTGTSNGFLHSFTHTPVGTPRGVILLVCNSTQNADWDGGAEYGGVPMSPVQTQQQNAGSEFGGVHAFFLGSGIPTGPQTVSVEKTVFDFGITCFLVCITITAAGNTVVVDSDGISATSGANPSVSLSTDRDTFVAGMLWSGQNAPTSITEGASQTSITEEDFGNDVGGASRMTSIQSPGSITYGWTMATEEHAMAVLAVGEIANVVPVGQAEETDTALRLANIVGRTNETDLAQVISPVQGDLVAVGQALETDLAQPIRTPSVVGQASELDRAQQVALVGGTLPISDAPVLIRAPRKAGRIFHEIVAPSGESFHPSIAEWQAEEDAPGGFRGAKGLVSARVMQAHREVFSPDSIWRTFLEDGTCIFAGRLKRPDPDGTVVQLSAAGRATIADKEIGPILYQAHVGSQLSHFSNDSLRWGVEFTTMSHSFVDTGIVFRRNASQPAGDAHIIIPFFGRELAFLRMHVQGNGGFLSVQTSRGVKDPSILNSAELAINQTRENWYFYFPIGVHTVGQAEIDLVAGTELLSAFNSTAFSNVTPTSTAFDTGWGFIWPDLLMIECSDWADTPDASTPEVLLSNIEINGSPVGTSRRYSVGDLVEDIAARLGFRDVNAGGAYDITPYELPPGTPASEALDFACLISGRRYRILDTGSRATFEFGRWNEHTWALASPWSPLNTIPEDRYDAVAVPYQYPGTHGQLTDQVVVRADDSPLLQRRINWDLALADPAHNRDRAIDLGARYAEELIQQNYTGDFAAAELVGPDGEKLSAHHANAGDILHPWRGRGEPGRLFIGTLTRFDDHVEGTFASTNRPLERMLARREKRLTDRG